MELAKLFLTGKWRDSDRNALLDGITAVGQALAMVTGETPDAVYGRILGGLKFGLSYSLQNNLHAYSYRNRINFKPGHVTGKLAVHEHFHVLDKRMDFLPGKTLAEGIFTPGGVLLAGIDPRDHVFKRCGGLKAQDNGLRSDRYEDGFVIHPIYWPGGNTYSEAFADLGLNFVMNSFAENEAGETLRNWVNEHMGVWLKDAKRESEA